jgi:hypothetical protein
MALLIESETFGMSKMLANIGSLMELKSLGPGATELTWSFFHEPRGLLGALMNRLVILRQQRANRLRALESFKAFAETGATRPAHDPQTSLRSQSGVTILGPGRFE